MAKESFGFRRLPRAGSRGQGPGHRRAPQEFTEEVQGTTPLLPARPPHRHQHGLRPRPGPGPAAAPDLAQDDPEADGQLRPPVGGVQARLTQEREQVVALCVATACSITALPLAVAALLVSRFRNPLGRGLDAYDFSTPRAELESEAKITANGDVRAMLELTRRTTGR